MRLEALRAIPEAWTVHGLRFAQRPELEADVQLTFAATPESLPRPVLCNARRDVAPGDWLVRLAPDQRLRASGGCRLTVDAPADADQGNLIRWVEGAATAALLYQRGRLPLHASAVVWRGALLAFLAPSGTGKSSLAAAFVNQGAEAFTDDLLALLPDASGTPRALRGSSQLRLPTATWEAIRFTTFQLLRTDPDGKRVVATGSQDRPESLPLSALFLLETGAAFDVAPVGGFDLFHRLRHLLTRPALARTLGTEATILAGLGRLAAQVPAWRIRRPAAGWTLETVSSAVRQCVVTGATLPALRRS